MAGLAHDAAHFFKFLFILVLYTLVMTLWVRILFVATRAGLTSRITELPARNRLPQRRYRNPRLGSDGVVPNDLCWILCSLDIHSTSATMAAMVVSSEGTVRLMQRVHITHISIYLVHPRSALRKRGGLRAHDRRSTTRRPDRYLCILDHGNGTCLTLHWLRVCSSAVSSLALTLAVTIEMC